MKWIYKAFAVMMPALLMAGCSGRENMPKMSDISLTAAVQTDPSETVFAAGRDIDPQAAEHGADGIPFFFSDKNENYSFVPSESTVKFNGRYLFYNDICWLGYTCSSVSFVMTGDRAEAVLTSNGGVYSDRQQGWFGVMINGELTNRIRLKDGENSYVLYEGEQLENAEITIIKLSENQMASTGIKSVTCNAERLSKAAKKDISIEFIGDSITCGYGNEAEGPSDGFDSDMQNGAATYGYYTAQSLNADWSMVCISGIGLISDYTDTVGIKEDYLLAGEIYDYSDVNFQQRRGIAPLEKWDFHGGSDVVVINLGTNDYSYTGKDESLQGEFYSAYYDFLGDVRKHNPDADIICTMGIMGAELYGQIEEAVKDFSSDNDDRHIYTMKFDYQREEDGYGGDYHPTVATHKRAAEQLVKYIKENKIV